MSPDYPYDSPLDAPDTENEGVSRRDLLRQGTAAIVGGGAAVLGGGTAFAQAPAVVTQPASRTAGRRFRALVRYRTNLDVQELTLNPIHPRQIVAREIGRAHV